MKFTGKDGTLRIYNRLYGYLEVHFSNMDFSSAIGRAKADEILVLDNGKVSEYSHYIGGNDMVIYDPVGITFSCVIEDITSVNTTNGFKEIVFEALTCRDARNDQTDGTWTGFGVSTKGYYSNKVGQLNPKFAIPSRNVYTTGTLTNVQWTGSIGVLSDSSKNYASGEPVNYIIKMTSGAASGKSYQVLGNTATTYSIDENPVTAGILTGDTYEMYDNLRCVDVEFKLNSPDANSIVWAFREAYFPNQEITLAEAEDGITMSATGGFYGPVVRSTDWIAPA